MYLIIGNLLLGLSLFLGGMAVMRFSLQALAGPRLKNILCCLTDNLPSGIIAGAGITAFIQSSSAVLAVLIGLVNAGVIPFSNVFGVIFGANIGTTFTIQLISFQLSDYALWISIGGLIITLYGVYKRWDGLKYSGLAVFGFGQLFLGMRHMGFSLILLESYERFMLVMLEVREHNIFGLILGMLLTGVSQSSSAITGIIIALLNDEVLTLKSALPVLLGCNVGTCMTALLASLGSDYRGKRTALIHLIFNVTGAVVFFIFLNPFVRLISLTTDSPVRQFANAHTIFNVANTLLLLPFIPFIDFLVRLILPGE